MLNILRNSILGSLLSGVVLVVLLIISICNAMVELTSGGTYRYIYLPLGFTTIKWNAQGRLQAENPALQNMQGPVVQRQADKLKVSSYCYDSIIYFELAPDATQFKLNCKKRSHYYTISPTIAPPPVDYEMHSKVAVVSDLEGNISYFNLWAEQLKITDEYGNWQYGDGQVVILGDAVNRGRQTLDLLWRLYELDLQAQKTFGRVWLVTGNHEQYILHGLTDRAEVEHLWAIEQLMPYSSAFSNSTVLGQWMRGQPIILKLGEFLFAHGGISPDVIAAQLSVPELNKLYHQSLDAQTVSQQVYNLFYGPNGLSQYRKVISEYAESPEQRSELLRQVHEYYKTRYLVVGHTPVPTVRIDHKNGLIVVETDDLTNEAMVIEQGNPKLYFLTESKENYSDNATQFRPFMIFNKHDWAAFLPDFVRLNRLKAAKAFFNGKTLNKDGI